MEPSQSRILFVGPSYGCRPVTGAGQRTALILKALRQLATVDVLLLGTRAVEGYRQYFPGVDNFYIVPPKERGELGLWRLVRPLRPAQVDAIATRVGTKQSGYLPDPTVSDFLQQQLARYDYRCIVGRYLRPTARSGALEQTQVPVILDVDDRDEAVYESRLNQPGLSALQRFAFNRYYRQLKAVSAQLLPKCHHLWLASDADAGSMPHSSKSVLPNIPYVTDLARQTPFPEDADTQTILFVGSYAHRVNKEGVERFLKHCWPKIHAAVPDAKLRVVGSGKWEAAREQFGGLPNVEIVGFVDNLADEYRRAAFSVVPLFEGGGTKIKVLESLYYQRTEVVTTHARYGYDQLQHNQALWEAEDEAGLVEGCIYLLNHPEVRSRLAARGREVVLSRYTFPRFAQSVEESIAPLLKVSLPV